MLRSLHNLKREGAVFSAFLSLLCINAAFADSSSDRLAAYKANKLIPANVCIDVGDQSDAEATFVPAQWTWAIARNAGLLNLAATFSGWSLEDFQNYDWLSLSGIEDRRKANEAYFNYLTKVANGEITPECSELTKDLATQLKLAFLRDDYTRTSVLGDSPAFEFSGTEHLADYTSTIAGANLTNCKGLTLSQFYDVSLYDTSLPDITVQGNEDFSRLSMSDLMDLSSLKGITAGQLVQFGLISNCKVPNMQCDGSEDFSKFNISGGDLSGWTGITGTQVLQAISTGRADSVTWPATLTFTGTEDFSSANVKNRDLSLFKGITAAQLTTTELTGTVLPAADFTGAPGFTQSIQRADLTQCTGLTAQQITSSSNWVNIKLTQAQYDSMANDLAASMPTNKSKRIYIDGVLKTIRGTAAQ